MITLKQLVTTSNEAILTFWRPEKLTATVRLRRLNTGLDVTADSVKLLLSLCRFTDSFRVKHLKFLLQIFLSRFQVPADV